MCTESLEGSKGIAMLICSSFFIFVFIKLSGQVSRFQFAQVLQLLSTPPPSHVLAAAFTDSGAYKRPLTTKNCTAIRNVAKNLTILDAFVGLISSAK